jgi:signal recognition particle GTPase
MGDWSGFMDKIHEVVPTDQQPELLQKLSEGTFSLGLMYEQFQNIMKMGPIGQVNCVSISMLKCFKNVYELSGTQLRVCFASFVLLKSDS